MTLKTIIKNIIGIGAPNEFTDEKLRDRFSRDHNISIGLYSYGCFDRSRIDPNTTIGRYCSFARTAHIFNRNHGTAFLSTTPYLYNAALGFVADDTIPYESCEVSDDVWIGHNALITASARKIGRGAVVAAGAIVTRDVEPYTIVAGTPAVVIRRRFEKPTIERIESLRWWEWTIDELKDYVRANPNMVFTPATSTMP
ncbi:MAG: CatB-related O-acetyltransferase [bacterium]|nr:CatB-related O-acetyltransferase [bacterium]